MKQKVKLNNKQKHGRKKNFFTKGIATCLTMALIAGQTVPAVYGAEEASEKEEVVYAILDADGTVTGVYVVNSFAGGDIVDYGDYTSVRNLTTSDEISTDGDRITLSTQADKVYYQGNLATTDIPWKIEIHYYMDGTEYSPEEIAGKSGELKMTISIKENRSCEQRFWEGYALQASLALDSNKCENIVADGATIANVGSDKQLSYIILPGKGGEFTITSDVEDFEMDGISINGMRLNLDLEVESDELTEQIEEIQDAIASLNDGAEELNSGAKKIYDGSVTLSDGAYSLNNGVTTLNQGIQQVQNGLTELNSKSAALNSGSDEMTAALKQLQDSLNEVSMSAEELEQLSSSSTQIENGIDTLVAGLNTMDRNIDGYYSLLNTSLSNANIPYTDQNTGTGTVNNASSLKTANAQLAETYYQLAQSVNQTSNEYQLYMKTYAILTADAGYIEASEALISGIDASLGIRENYATTVSTNQWTLMEGAVALQTNYTEFDRNIQAMVASLNTLSGNMTKLQAAVNQISTAYAGIDSGIEEYTNAVNQITQGYSAICSGSLEVVDGTKQLYIGTRDMTQGTLELYEGSTELLDGTNEFVTETENMETQVTDSIDETIDEMTGKNVEVVSFVSEKNTNVDSVLFVIKKDKIEIPEEEETVVTEEEKVSFWQKLLELFR